MSDANAAFAVSKRGRKFAAKRQGLDHDESVDV
jgi:hypothetical protein